MAKRKHTYWLEDEMHALIKSEAARLGESGANGRVSEADVIALAVMAWCTSGASEDAPAPMEVSGSDLRRAAAEKAMRQVESRPVETPTTLTEKTKARAESVAERKAREAGEHAAALAESDTVARLVGRDDIEYDLDNVAHRSVVAGATRTDGRSAHVHYQIELRKVKMLTRPHGHAEPKRRREQ